MQEINTYSLIFDILKAKISQARQRASIAVNKELLLIYWEIGNIILQQQLKEGWGAKIIDKLSVDLKTVFPDFKGLSVRNLKYMKAFAEAYPDFAIVQPLAAQLQNAGKQNVTFVQSLAAQIPWTHHTIILNKVNTAELRQFYIRKTAENGWSKSVLQIQIKNELHLRQGNAITNFTETLPAVQSDLAKETLKNPYLFDFLGIGEEIQERDLEKALIQHMKKFMLELGRGFAYIGNQYNINVQDDDYFLDLLFYNYHLHCFVVFELKVGDFKPEFAGKLNFYVNTINEKIKGKEDKPTIGVLLCKTPNETVVKYSLKGIDTPMGVAEYEFTQALPKQLKGEMPSIEELEDELDKEVQAVKKPIDEKRLQLSEVLARLKEEEVEKAKDLESVLYLFDNLINPLKKKVTILLKEEISLFTKTEFYYTINSSGSPYFVNIDIEKMYLQKEYIEKIGVDIRLTGLKKAGINTFNINEGLYIFFSELSYTIGESRDKIWGKFLYHKIWNDGDIEEIAARWSEYIIDEIKRRLEQIIE